MFSLLLNIHSDCHYASDRSDGTAGIRVDRPKREINDFPLPKTMADWKRLGNEFMKESADGALICYDKALSCDDHICTKTGKQ